MVEAVYRALATLEREVAFKESSNSATSRAVSIFRRRNAIYLTTNKLPDTPHKKLPLSLPEEG